MMQTKAKIEDQHYPVPHPIGLPYTETPVPAPDIPAVLSFIIRRHGTDEHGEARDLLFFYIGRDPSIRLTAFTIAYRFSSLPIMMEDPAHPFHTYEYTDTNINDDNDYIVCRFSLPPSYAENFPGCTAYVKAVTREDGVYTEFSRDSFNYSDADMARMLPAMETLYANTDEHKDTVPDSTASDEDDTYDALLSAQRGQEAGRHKRRSFTRFIGYAVFAVGLIVLLSVGMQYLSYQKTMIGAQVYIDAKEYRQAEQYAEGESGDNLFYISRRTSLSQTTDRLCAEGRYNEAYKIASFSPYASVMQDICRQAANTALDAGDYETAYVYALGAPDPFDAEITSAAAAVILDPYTETMNESAYTVAQKTTDAGARDDLLLNLVRYACGENKYHVAMRAACAITHEETRSSTVADVFGIATRYYINRSSYEAAADFITLYSADGNTVDRDVEDALIAYFSESRDADSAFFLAKQFGIDASDIPIAPEDPAVREDLTGIYPLLTEAQKRSYHARRITGDGVLFALDDKGRARLSVKPSGAVPAGGKDTSMEAAQKRVDDLLGRIPVVSVASGELVTVFLHNDGTLSVISNRIIGGTETSASVEELRLITAGEQLKNVIAVVAGEEHFVCLHANGTVSCFGDNTYGQCNTSSMVAWTDIAAIAAGDHFTVGLRTDGTVVAVGANDAGQCDTMDFRNVVEIEACDRTTVVLFSDGTAGIRGERSMGIADVTRLTDITRIRAGGCAIIAETKDGTYTICGTAADTGNYGSTASWRNLTDYAVGSVSASALDADGRIRTTGTNRAKQ